MSEGKSKKEGDEVSSPILFSEKRKICNICKAEKSFLDFQKSRNSVRAFCKACYKDIRKFDNQRLCEFKKSAKKRNIEFSLSKDEFSKIRSQACFYCGEKNENMSIDRIDSDVGYFFENCLPCCIPCNFMKFNLNVSSFLNKIGKIYIRQKSIGNIND